MTPPRVAVIGAGLTGLAAAVRLRELGIDTVLFERSDQVGGVVRTVHSNGWMVDEGPCMAAEPEVTIREWLDRAGAAGCTVRAHESAGNRFIVRDGIPVPLPRTTAELSSSAVLSLAGRLRLLKERLIPAGKGPDEESVDAFARRRFGDEMADRMFEPLLASMAAGDAREVLAAYAFPAAVGHEARGASSLQGSARSRMDARRKARNRPMGSWSCAEGMQQLAELLAAGAGEIQFGAGIDAVSVVGSRLQCSAPGISDSFDGVLLAVPAPALSRVDVGVPEAQRVDAIIGIPHASVATVSLGYRRADVRHPLDGSRLLVPAVENRAILSSVFPSSLFAHRAPDDHVLLTAFVGGARRPDMVDQSDQAMIDLVAGEFIQLLGAHAAPVFAHVRRWPLSLPQAVRGHGGRLAEADQIELATPGLAFAGAWRDGLSVGEVLRGGLRAADRLAGRNRWPGANAVA
jgi:oxygen-dependent protoporphyrinogen oxidase